MFNEIPGDCIIHILENLKLREIIKLNIINRKFLELIDVKLIRMILKLHFGIDTENDIDVYRNARMIVNEPIISTWNHQLHVFSNFNIMNYSRSTMITNLFGKSKHKTVDDKQHVLTVMKDSYLWHDYNNISISDSCSNVIDTIGVNKLKGTINTDIKIALGHYVILEQYGMTYLEPIRGGNYLYGNRTLYHNFEMIKHVKDLFYEMENL